MTVEEAINEVKRNIKGLYLRSIKNGEVYKKYNDVSEIDKEILSQSTPGYTEVFGRVIIDMY